MSKLPVLTFALAVLVVGTQSVSVAAVLFEFVSPGLEPSTCKPVERTVCCFLPQVCS
jgi:hypothetical protein